MPLCRNKEGLIKLIRGEFLTKEESAEQEKITLDWEEKSTKCSSFLDHINVLYLIKTEKKILLSNLNIELDISGHIESINWRNDATHRIVCNSNHTEIKRRFAIAHELGHYALHRDVLGAGTNDDNSYCGTKDYLHYNDAITLNHEMQANEFACRILMPRSFMERLFNGKTKKIDEVITFRDELMDATQPRRMDAKKIAKMAFDLKVEKRVLITRLSMDDLNDLRG